MDDRTRFAVCGIDCITCSIHLRTEEALQYQKSKNRDPDRVACDGCRSDRNSCHWGRDCALLNCCHYEKGLDLRGSNARYDQDDRRPDLRRHAEE